MTKNWCSRDQHIKGKRLLLMSDIFVEGGQDCKKDFDFIYFLRHYAPVGDIGCARLYQLDV